jgi:hypothetical protein
MPYQPQHATPAPVVVDNESRTIRPANPDGDEFFGLANGTNGTGAIARRDAAERTETATGYTWLRSNGQSATGLQLVPSNKSDATWAPLWPGSRL